MIKVQRHQQRALEEGLGFKRTKAGAGDKDVAYTVRQGHCMRIVLGIAVFLLVVLTSFVSYMQWFNKFRWETVSSEVFHYVSDKNVHTKLLETQLELKEALEILLHQTHRVSEYRSYLENTLEFNGDKLRKALSDEMHLDDGFSEKLVKENDVIGTKAIKELDAIMNQFRNQNVDAIKRLSSLSDEIIENVDDGRADHDKYHEKLKTLGVMSKSAADKFKDDKWQTVSEEQKKIMEKVEIKIEYFFKKVVELPTIHITEKTIEEWQLYLKEIVLTLRDDKQEADIKGIIRKVNEMILQDGKGEIQLFDSSTDRSIVDYLKERIAEANLAHHRESLLELYNEWKSGKKRSVLVLREMEKLAQHHRAPWRDMA